MPTQPAPGDSPPTDLPPPDRKSSGRKSSGGQPSPHDSVFRRFFGVPENAASELRAVLPPDLTARLDLGGLDPVPTSSVDGELTWRHSDLLFKTKLDGSDAYVYLLIEHQSSNDPLMAFRMLIYVTRIWEKYLRDNTKARQLPAVIPLVVYYADRRWTAPTQMLDLIDLDPADKKAAEPYLPRFEFLLDDLTRVGDSQLLDRQLLPPALMTLVIIKIAPGNPNVAAELRKWKQQLRAVLDGPDGFQEFIALINYTERVSEAPARELHELAASLGPDAEEAYMTTAEMLRAEGEVRGEAKTLALMLTVKFGPLPDSVTRTVHGASSDQVQAWTIRAVTAETLDQVFALAAECGFGRPVTAQRPVASGQSRPRPRRPVADIISEQRHLRTAALTAAIADASLSQQIDTAADAAEADDSGQAATAAGRALLAGDDEW